MRTGNKRVIAEKIINLFPEHETYIEPFFGAGGLFFKKPLAKYNIVNDLDDDVFNFFMVLKNHRKEFIELIKQTPVHESLLRYWKQNKETEPLMKAMRFVFFSNYTLYAKGNTLLLENSNAKTFLLRKLKSLNGKLENVIFANRDYKDFISSIKSRINNEKTLVYCDPPYIGTNSSYKGFSKEEFTEMVDLLNSKKFNFAISEFDSEFIRQTAKDKGLNFYFIGERRNIHNRRVEILLTNYVANKQLFYQPKLSPIE